MTNTKISYFSHLFSFASINLIIGWGNSFYIIKLLFFVLIGLISLYVIFKNVSFRFAKVYLLILLSVILSFLYHHVLIGDLSNIDSIKFITNILTPVIFGLLVYQVVPFVKIQTFVLYLKIFIVCSIIFIFIQFLGIWQINTIFLSNEFVEMLASNPGAAYVGISSSPFYMATQLALITPILLSKPLKQKLKNIFFLIFAYASGQRAYFLSIVLNILRKKLKPWMIILIFLILTPVALAALFSGVSSVIFRGYDADRFILYLAGINYVIEYPYGVGGFSYYSQTIEEVSRKSNFLVLYLDIISRYPPHNFFINSAMIHGIPFLFPVFYFLFKVYKLNNPFSWGFMFGVLVSMFHNLSFLYADFFSWIILAFAFHYNKMSIKTYD